MTTVPLHVSSSHTGHCSVLQESHGKYLHSSINISFIKSIPIHLIWTRSFGVSVLDTALIKIVAHIHLNVMPLLGHRVRQGTETSPSVSSWASAEMTAVKLH